MFVALDGEGYTITETGEHIYNMMGSSLGNWVYERNGLRTIDCFEFLFQTKKEAPRKSNFVAFAFNYDVNMILRDLGKSRLIELWIEGETRWRDFRINWLPTKFFQVRDCINRRSVRIYDTFGFFQCSFAKALAGWNVDAPDQLDHMKASRSAFTDDMRDKVAEYCLAECSSLVELMERLKESLHSVGLFPRGWHGAGAIAAALLKREGIEDHVIHDEDLPLYEPIMHAYFGGRTELFKQGEFENLYGYDIRSAYPAATRELPSLKGSRWVHDKRFVARREVISIHRVKWKTDPACYIQPFPYRYRRSIYYPTEGEGYYWSCEVEAAKRIHGDNIEQLDAWVLDVRCLDRPFNFVDPIYSERARLKREGHLGHQSLKLAINALYGKLAQGVGFQGRLPQFRSYVWAGWITAMCRSRMLGYANENVVMICTDGIYFDKDPGLPESEGLGGLERNHVHNAFIAQPGIYEGRSDEREILRSRGVFAKEIDFEDLRRGFKRNGPYYVSNTDTTRFVGLGSCITLRRFDTWRRWEESRRKISLYPSRKFVLDEDTRPVVHVPPSGFGGVSEIYVPKKSGLDAPGIIDWIQALEQPTREGVG